MNTLSSKCTWLVRLVGAVCVAFTLSIGAQVETKTTTETKKATVVTKVDRGEVVTVSGNDLVVKMADGSIRHISSVPESVRVTVEGEQLGIHDLKPGMKLARTITSTTIPKTITTVQTVTGKVWAINPPLSIILTLEDGKNQQFKIPEGQDFNVDGQIVDAWGVRKGMTITATKIVEVPAVEVTQKKTVTGEAAPVVPANIPILVAEGTEEPLPPPSTATVPVVTRSPLSTTWLSVLVGLIVLGAIIGWRRIRKNRLHS
jgi:hypothetical protein